MALSRLLTAFAATLCITALLAVAWVPPSSARLADLSSSQLAEEIRDDLDSLPEKLLPPPLEIASIPHAFLGGGLHLYRAGLGPRGGHLRPLLRPPRS